jgi:hypothetical protein
LSAGLGPERRRVEEEFDTFESGAAEVRSKHQQELEKLERSSG